MQPALAQSAQEQQMPAAAAAAAADEVMSSNKAAKVVYDKLRSRTNWYNTQFL
jgi:hypothetical protein